MTRLVPLAIAIVVLSACSGESVTGPASNGSADLTVAQMFGHWDFSMGPFEGSASDGVWSCGGNGTLVVAQQAGKTFTGYVSANELHGVAAVLDCLLMQGGQVNRELFSDLGDFGFDASGNPFVADTGTVQDLNVSFSLRDRVDQLCTWEGTLSADGSTISGTARCTMPFGGTLEAPLLAARREICPATPTGVRRQDS